MHLDWGLFEQAENHFRLDLDFSQRILDERGIAQMYNYLGQLALARRKAGEAAVYLDHSIENARGRWGDIEAFARKDRALCYLVEGDTTGAHEQLQAARRLFEQHGMPEGLAHVNRARGILLRIEQHWNESGHHLRRALEFFEQIQDLSEIARTRLELARLLKAKGVPLPLVRDEFRAAVMQAEQSRRPHLVQDADRELAEIDPATGAQHVYRRIRGRRIDGDSTSLTSAERDIVTVFFFDLQGFTAWSRNTDPSVVMVGLNQMMARFLDATTRHDVQVIEYMGDGFLALSRGQHHARRAVAASLDLYAALGQLNRPRRILQLSEFTCRIGISTGEVVLGNVGTYDKIDYRAVGTTVNIAARIQNKAISGCPCVSQATWEAVQSEFEPNSRLPRKLSFKGLGRQTVFDIRGRKQSVPVK
jgi:class 3 adenylate cyclase